jgi:ParB-like chromosome segregation protein Spo0J
MVELPIEEVLRSRPVDPRRHLDGQRVQRFALLIDELPPVTVFRIEDGSLLLVDGYHRVAAAQEAGRVTVRAELRDGTKSDALRFAMELAAQQRGTSFEAARSAIEKAQRRMKARALARARRL